MIQGVPDAQIKDFARDFVRPALMQMADYDLRKGEPVKCMWSPRPGTLMMELQNPSLAESAPRILNGLHLLGCDLTVTKVLGEAAYEVPTAPITSTFENNSMTVLLEAQANGTGVYDSITQNGSCEDQDDAGCGAWAVGETAENRAITACGTGKCCAFVATWHATHCCGVCKNTGGAQHAPRCDQALRRPTIGDTVVMQDVETTRDGFPQGIGKTFVVCEDDGSDAPYQIEGLPSFWFDGDELKLFVEPPVILAEPAPKAPVLEAPAPALKDKEESQPDEKDMSNMQLAVLADPDQEKEQEKKSMLQHQRGQPLKIVFRVTGKPRTLVFPHSPLGLVFRNKLPIFITDITPFGQADALGAEVGWEFLAVAGMNVEGREWSDVAKRILDYCTPLPKRPPPPALSLTIAFDMDGETTAHTFCRRPLGMTFGPKLPFVVTRVIPNSNAEELGVQPGWEVKHLLGKDADEQEHSVSAAGKSNAELMNFVRDLSITLMN